jgi:hypothetical protein
MSIRCDQFELDEANVHLTRRRIQRSDLAPRPKRAVGMMQAGH